jgi:hypothetical protein
MREIDHVRRTRRRARRSGPGACHGRPGHRVALLLSVVLLAPACEVPDPLEGLPPEAIRFLDPARSSMETVADGVVYRGIQSGSEPWSVHLLEIDPTRCEIGFQVVGLEDPEGGRAPVSDLARRAMPGAVAAVNGDFFTEENHAIGVEAMGGVLRGRTSRPVFAWRPGDLPRLSEVVWEGDSLRVGEWSLVRGQPDGRTELVAGFPRLLRDGVRVGDLQAGDRPAFSTSRHPRTALGWDEGQARLWVVVVDGRREGVSEGMTLAELAGLFEALGAREALNLDGGGSSTMVVSGRVVSRPSDPTGPRPVVNALVVREDPDLCRLPGG